MGFPIFSENQHSVGFPVTPTGSPRNVHEQLPKSPAEFFYITPWNLDGLDWPVNFVLSFCLQLLAHHVQHVKEFKMRDPVLQPQTS